MGCLPAFWCLPPELKFVLGLSKTLIVTKLDTIKSANLRWTLRGEIAAEFGLPGYKVNLVSNYTENSQKDFQIDKVALRVSSLILSTPLSL